jgi:DNA helicase-2/ATP-dependent DNA helicase PcrA
MGVVPAIEAEERLLARLNPAQRQAVLHTEGPLLVLAGAGSGKTRVLTTRIARLIETLGVNPRAILAVTFTNKAAGEMRERVGSQLGVDPKGMWIGTFHSVGARMLRMTPHLVGLDRSFTIYDQDDTIAALKRVMERLRVPAKEYTPRAIQSAISGAKNTLTTPTEYDKIAIDPFTKVVAAIYPEYDKALRLANAVDFDDLLVLPVKLLRDNPGELERYQSRFRYILVDEYQDTNRAQYQWIKLLGAGHGNVCVVGDDDQSIYGWRGADIKNILDFSRDFESAAVVRLEENYRSTPQVLDLANVVIKHNTTRMGKTLRATRDGGDRVTAVRSLDERDEADWVTSEMLAQMSRGRAYRDLAVLYRTNAQSRAMEEALRRQSIPYRLIGAVGFYDRREIRDLMAYLKLIANPADNEAFRRAVGVPRRGLGDTSIEMLADRAQTAGLSMFDAAQRADMLDGMRPAARTAMAEFVRLITDFRSRAENEGVDELLRDLIAAIRYDEHLKAEGPEAADRLDNVRELLASAAEQVVDDLGEVGLRPLDHFLQRTTLVADVDALDGESDAVVLMTLHNAKGLEFPVVFISGLEDGLFPLAKAFDNPPLLEEERRLFYVGITRAEEKLFLSHAEERRRNGELLPARRSSFLDAIPDTMLDHRSTVKVRSSGRTAMRAGAWGSYGSQRSTRPSALGEDDSFHRMRSPTVRRPGTPVFTSAPVVAEEDVSQDAAFFAIGARVKHRKFGSGTIAEIAGSGRDAKVRIDFDDEEVGRKTLVVAQANLERGDE